MLGNNSKKFDVETKWVSFQISLERYEKYMKDKINTFII